MGRGNLQGNKVQLYAINTSQSNSIEKKRAIERDSTDRKNNKVDHRSSHNASQDVTSETKVNEFYSVKFS